jgi:hypothetical protein
MSDVTLNAPTVAGGKIVKTRTVETNKEIQVVEEARALTGTITQTTNVADEEIVVAAARKSVRFYNDGDQDYLLGEGATTVTTSIFSYRVKANGGCVVTDDFDGAYHGFYVSAPSGSGSLKITVVA